MVLRYVVKAHGNSPIDIDQSSCDIAGSRSSASSRRHLDFSVGRPNPFISKRGREQLHGLYSPAWLSSTSVGIMAATKYG